MTRATISVVWLFVLLPGVCDAEAALQWRQAQSGGAGHGMSHRAGANGILLLGGDGASTEIVLPTLEHRHLAVSDGHAVLRPTGFDNYHLLLATRDSGKRHEAALRYQSFSGRPSGHSPTELVNSSKVSLEILPLPLPREHSRYLAGTAAVFLVRFHGRALARHPIALETSNGTRLFSATDDSGRFFLPLPDDFTSAAAAHLQRVPADFALATRMEEEGHAFYTTLSAEYFRNPQHWQSSRYGRWIALAGFMVGFGLLRWVSRRKPAPDVRRKGAA